MIKSRKMKWEWYVARIREKGNAYRILVGKPERKRRLGRHRHKWRIILKSILELYDRVVWTGLIWLRIRTSGELL
jgi:hypothetical protein